MLPRARSHGIVVFDVANVLQMNSVPTTHGDGHLVAELEVRSKPRLVDDEWETERLHSFA